MATWYVVLYAVRDDEGRIRTEMGKRTQQAAGDNLLDVHGVLWLCYVLSRCAPKDLAKQHHNK